jgi:hypothetical protein
VLLAGSVIGICALAAISVAPAQGDALLFQQATEPTIPFLTTSSEESPIVPPGFTVKASNGYSIFVVGVAAHKGKPASIGIFVTGRRDGAFYAAPASVTETSIQADLGALGQIAVVFHPAGQARTERSECGGNPVSLESGSYEGEIEFHGEEGYTTFEGTQAQGGIGFLLDVLCPGISGGSGGPFLPGAELDVNPRQSQPGPDLKVVKNSPRALAHFEVGIDEAREGISISRFSDPTAPAEAFEYDPKVQTATVHPSVPFAGRAQFRRNARQANRWTGNLTVDLPGRSGVHLTGGDLRASLAHARWDFSPP